MFRGARAPRHDGGTPRDARTTNGGIQDVQSRNRSETVLGKEGVAFILLVYVSSVLITTLAMLVEGSVATSILLIGLSVSIVPGNRISLPKTRWCAEKPERLGKRFRGRDSFLKFHRCDYSKLRDKVAQIVFETLASSFRTTVLPW